MRFDYRLQPSESQSDAEWLRHFRIRSKQGRDHRNRKRTRQTPVALLSIPTPALCPKKNRSSAELVLSDRTRSEADRQDCGASKHWSILRPTFHAISTWMNWPKRELEFLSLRKTLQANNGCQPHQYILHLRLERAKELLRKPALTLSEISQHAGFSDQSHFTNVFRRLVGVPPSTYRSLLLLSLPLSVRNVAANRA